MAKRMIKPLTGLAKRMLETLEVCDNVGVLLAFLLMRDDQEVEIGAGEDSFHMEHLEDRIRNTEPKYLRQIAKICGVK